MQKNTCGKRKLMRTMLITTRIKLVEITTKNKVIQPWDYIVANDMGYLAGNIIKYVTRYKDKNGVEDLKKARHYLDKLIEVTVK